MTVDTPLLVPAALVGFLVAPLAPLLARALGRWVGWALALVPASVALFLLTRMGLLGSETALTASLSWIPGLDVSLSFYVDGLSLLMALVVTVRSASQRNPRAFIACMKRIAASFAESDSPRAKMSAAATCKGRGRRGARIQKSGSTLSCSGKRRRRVLSSESLTN